MMQAIPSLPLNYAHDNKAREIQPESCILEAISQIVQAPNTPTPAFVPPQESDSQPAQSISTTISSISASLNIHAAITIHETTSYFTTVPGEIVRLTLTETRTATPTITSYLAEGSPILASQAPINISPSFDEREPATEQSFPRKPASGVIFRPVNPSMMDTASKPPTPEDMALQDAVFALQHAMAIPISQPSSTAMRLKPPEEQAEHAVQQYADGLPDGIFSPEDRGFKQDKYGLLNTPQFVMNPSKKATAPQPPLPWVADTFNDRERAYWEPASPDLTLAGPRRRDVLSSIPGGAVFISAEGETATKEVENQEVAEREEAAKQEADLEIAMFRWMIELGQPAATYPEYGDPDICLDPRPQWRYGYNPVTCVASIGCDDSKGAC